MSGRKVRSDAMGTAGVEYMDTGGKSTKQYVEDTVREAMAEVNKATAFARTNYGGGMTGAHAGNVSYTSSGRGGGTTNQFNIVGGTIGQAAIGNQGDVVFNKEKKVFNKGAKNTQYNISGGNFSQANIGGTSTYNNKDSTIGGGGSVTGLSAEYLTLSILEKGVTVEQLMRLLERNYSLANIAFAVPADPVLKDRMVEALLVK